MKNFKWDKKYLYWGITAFLVVVSSIAFFWLLRSLPSIGAVVSVIVSALSPVVYGILIAYLLNRVLTIFEKRLFSGLARRIFPKSPVRAKKTARVLSIILTMSLVLGAIAGLLVIILPEIYASIEKLLTSSQDYLEVAIRWVEHVLDGYALEDVAVEWVNSISGSVVEWLQNNVLPKIGDILSSITGGVISVISTIVDLFIGLVISVYIMYNKETFCAQIKKITYSIFHVKAANVIIEEVSFIDDAFGNYIVGTLIDALIVGFFNYFFMVIMGMPYFVLITLMVSITNIIPVFGPFIGAIPSALLLLLESPMQALIFVIFTIVLQQIDGQIIKPRIHASRSGLSGFWIMFAILFFGGLFGIPGMLLGVPLTTVLYNILRRINNRILRRRGLPENTDFYRDIDHIDTASRKPVYKTSRAPASEPEEAPEPEPSPEPEAAPETEPASETSPAPETEPISETSPEADPPAPRRSRRGKTK